MNCVLTFGNGTTTPVPCNNVEGSPNLFSGTVEYSSYGYELNHAATYAFVAVYAAGFLAQVVMAFYWRCWWAIPTLVAGSLVETIGWVGRLLSIITWKWNPNGGGVWSTSFGSFIMQICCLVIGPTFFSAANYILLGRLIAVTGNGAYSSLAGRSFSIIFIIADVNSLFVQAAGGGIAGTANTREGSDNGAYIMTGGVVVQLVVTAIYVALFLEWVWRRKNDRPAKRQFDPFSRFTRKSKSKKTNSSTSNTNFNTNSNFDSEYMSRDNTLTNDIGLIARDGGQPLGKPKDGPSGTSVSYRNERGKERGMDRTVPYELEDKKVKLMSWLIVAGTSLIVIRSLYRSVELSNGWEGSIATNEPLFLGMDALLMALFVYLYAAVHPGIAFGNRSRRF